jgi:hypothetical protein
MSTTTQHQATTLSLQPKWRSRRRSNFSTLQLTAAVLLPPQALFNEVIYFPSRPGYTDPLVKRRVLVSRFCQHVCDNCLAWEDEEQAAQSLACDLRVSAATDC